MTELVPVTAVVMVTAADCAQAWGITAQEVMPVLARATPPVVPYGASPDGRHLYVWDDAQRAWAWDAAQRAWDAAQRACHEASQPAPATGIVGPAPRHLYPERGRRIDPAAMELVFESVPASTRDAYGKMWRKFLRWCEDFGRCPYPCTGEDLLNFVSYLASTPTKANKMMAPSSIEIAMAAVRTYHRLHAARSGDTDVAPPDSVLAGKALKAYRLRWLKAGNRPQASKPLSHREIKQIMPTFDLDTLSGIRNKAVFLLGHGHSSRRSELCALDIGDITFTAYGMDVYLPFSKTDQAGRGAVTPLPFGKYPETCRVQAVKDLITCLGSHGITEGPLIRPIDLGGKRFAGEPGVDASNWACRRGGKHGSYALRITGWGIEKIIAKHVRAAGLTGRYTPHGLRAGGLSDRADEGADSTELADAGRYTPTSTIPQGYVRRSKAARTNSLKKVDL